MEIEDRDELEGGSFTDGMTIIADDDVFDPDETIPEVMPERISELKQIKNLLRPIARGSSPKNRLIFGKPGQGKTAALRYQLQRLEDASKTEDWNVNHIYVSCKQCNDSYKILQHMVMKLEGKASPPVGFTLSDLYHKVYTLMEEEGGAWVVVLDEVDEINPEQSKYDEPGEPHVLYQFPRSKSSGSIGDEISIGVVVISNDRQFIKDMNSRTADSLGERRMNFQPYTVDELVQILMRRADQGLQRSKVRIGSAETGFAHDFESDVVSEEVLRECAQMAAKERGSARQAIRYLGTAAEHAEMEQSSEIMSRHVKMAEEEVQLEYIHESLTDLTEHDLLALCGVLWCVALDEHPIMVSDVYNHYTTICSIVDERAKVQRRMRSRLKDMDLTGVINMEKRSKPDAGGMFYNINLAMPFNEVVEVLSERNPFQKRYGDIAEEVHTVAKQK